MTQSNKWYVTNTEDTPVTEPEEHTNEILLLLVSHTYRSLQQFYKTRLHKHSR